MKLLRTITERCGLHGESIPGTVLIEIHGEDRVLIENHRCVSSYSDSEVTVLVRFGSVQILGSGLVISSLQSDRLIIRGCIQSVSLQKGGSL